MSKKKDDCMEEQPGWYNAQLSDSDILNARLNSLPFSEPKQG